MDCYLWDEDDTNVIKILLSTLLDNIPSDSAERLNDVCRAWL